MHISDLSDRHQVALSPGDTKHKSLHALHVAEGQLSRCCLITSGHAGYPQYELVEGGSDTIVDSHNVGEYIDAVVNATMHEGIAAQMQAFR